MDLLEPPTSLGPHSSPSFKPLRQLDPKARCTGPMAPLTTSLSPDGSPPADEGLTSRGSPRSTVEPSSETSFYDETGAVVTVFKAVDMEIGVLGQILPTADPTFLASKDFGNNGGLYSAGVDAPEIISPNQLSEKDECGRSENLPSNPSPSASIPGTAKEFLDCSLVGHESAPTTDTSHCEYPDSVESATASSLVTEVQDTGSTETSTDQSLEPLNEIGPELQVQASHCPPDVRMLFSTPDSTVSRNSPAASIVEPTENLATYPTSNQNAARLEVRSSEEKNTQTSEAAGFINFVPDVSSENRTRLLDSQLESQTGVGPSLGNASGLPASNGHPSPVLPTQLSAIMQADISNPSSTSQESDTSATPSTVAMQAEAPTQAVAAITFIKDDHVSEAVETRRITEVPPTSSIKPSDPTGLEGDLPMENVEDPGVAERPVRKRKQSVLLKEFELNASDSEDKSLPALPPSKKKPRKSVEPAPTPASSTQPGKPKKKRVKKVAAQPAVTLSAPEAEHTSINAPLAPVLVPQALTQPPPSGETSPSIPPGAFIQKLRCGSYPPRISRCHACISRKTGEMCRYIDLRLFLGGTIKDPTGDPIWIDDPRPPQEILYPSQWNMEPTPDQIKRILSVAGNALLPYVAKELRHSLRPDAIRRNRELECRATCDYCATSIFETGWMCTICAREFCSECRDKIIHLTEQCSSEKEVAERMRARKPLHPKRQDNRLMYCQGGKAEHHGGDLRAITRFRKDELVNAISEMGIVSLESKMELLLKPEIDLSQYAPIPRRDPSDPVDPSGVESLPFHVFTNENLTEDIFKTIWEKGQTVVVTGLLNVFKLQWTPEEFIRRYGQQTCTVVDCDDDTGNPREMTVAKFFQRFGRYEDRTRCLKLKDWPPASLFSKEFPELYTDFADAVPVPNYTRRDGILNLAAHYPTNETAVVPDIGPKMYNAFESSELPGGKGSTRLHMDMADAVNVMLYAASRQDGSPGCAVWDIYRAEDSYKIRQFLFSKFGHTQTDPIHSQHYYLDSDLRRELFEQQGVKSWRIYQKPGEAVFIPAGCAHQVCNLADCIKVAVDFVSPENVGRCEVLTAEFRQQNLATAWKDDVLQLRHTLLYAWNSMKRMYPALSQK